MSNLSPLTEGDMGVCKLIAGIRTATARASETKRPFDTGYRNQIENEEASVIAEYAFCKTYNLFFNGVFGAKDSGCDCILKGKRIDIKCTTRPDGNLLVKEKTDKSNVDIYILIHVIDKVPTIKGWTFKDSLIQKQYLRTMPNKTVCYCMELKDLSTWSN